MSQDLQGFQPPLKPTTPAFNFNMAMGIGGAPVFAPQLYAHPPPFPVQYTFYPGPSVLPRFTVPSWQSNMRVVQPAAVVGVESYVHPTDVGLSWSSCSTSQQCKIQDATMKAFEERAKKCGITIQPTHDNAMGRSPAKQSGIESHAVAASSEYQLLYGDSTPEGAAYQLLKTSASDVSQSSLLTSGCIKSASDTSVLSPVTSCGRISATSSEPASYSYPSHTQSHVTVPSESSSDISITSSVLSFQSAADFSQKHEDAYLESATASVSGSDVRHTDDGQLQKFIVTRLTRESSQERSLYRDDDLESRQSFYSPLPAEIDERPNSVDTVNEFTVAAQRWRRCELTADVSSQTPVVMMVNACVGTASKVYVDASTNTDSPPSACQAVDAVTNTDKLDCLSPDAERLRTSSADVAAGRNIPSSSEGDRCETALRAPSVGCASTGREIGAVDSLSPHRTKHHHFLEFGAAMAGANQSAVHECPLSSPSGFRRILSLGLDGYESSEGSVCSFERASNATHSASEREKSGRQPPPGLEHYKDLAYNEEDGASKHSASERYLTADAVTRTREREGIDDSVLDDVYYSDDEDDGNATSQPVDSNADASHLPSSDMSAGIEDRINTQGTSLADSGLSMEEQQIIQQLMVQMVLVNPALASYNPLLLREIAVRYLISANLINPAVAQLENRIKQTLLQTHLLSTAGAASSDREFAESLASSVAAATERSLDERAVHGQSVDRRPSVDRGALPSFRVPRDRGPDLKYESEESEYRCRRVSLSDADDRPEFDLPIHERRPPRGRGRGVSSTLRSTDSRETRPRGRGRSQRSGIRDVDDHLGNTRLSDDVRPGLMARLQPSRTTPLHPPAAVQSKKATSAAGGGGPSQCDGIDGARRSFNEEQVQASGEDWDEDVDCYAPKVFTVNSSFYRTSRM